MIKAPDNAMMQKLYPNMFEIFYFVSTMREQVHSVFAKK